MHACRCPPPSPPPPPALTVLSPHARALGLGAHTGHCSLKLGRLAAAGAARREVQAQLASAARQLSWGDACTRLETGSSFVELRARLETAQAAESEQPECAALVLASCRAWSSPRVRGRVKCFLKAGGCRIASFLPCVSAHPPPPPLTALCRPAAMVAVFGRCSACSRRLADRITEIWRRIKLEFTVEVGAGRRGCAHQPPLEPLAAFFIAPVACAAWGE